MKNFVIFSFLVGFCFVARPLEEADNLMAVTSTQKLMTDKEQREAVFAKDAQAKSADEMAQKAMNGDPQKTEDLYDIAASLLPWIMQESAGDTTKANTLLLEATQNPKDFLKRIPASERAKIDTLAGKMEKEKSSKKTQP